MQDERRALENTAPSSRGRENGVPPGPKHTFSLYRLAMKHDPLTFLSKLAREYGDICHFQSGRQRVFLLNHPALVKELLVTQNHNFTKGQALSLAQELLGAGLLTSDGGEQHLAHRRAIQPGLRSQRIGAFGSLITGFTAEAAESWQEGRTLDVSGEMLELTLRIFSKLLFDLDYGREADEMRDATHRIFAAFELAPQAFARWRIRLPSPTMRRFRKARALIEATVYRMLRERRDTGDRGDLLSVMMGHYRPAGDGSRVTFTPEQIRDEIFTFIVAGNYTTASMLTWAWYMLAQHPAVEERLHAELESVLRGGTPTLASVDQLPYTRMVLSETLRMYPPVWLSSRKALADCDIGGYRIPAGAIVLASQYVIHRDPRFYPDPERFDPERWTPDTEAQRPRHAYFPFAVGPRACLGESFAWLEGSLILATLAQRWRLRISPGFRVRVHPGVILRPKHGLLMTVQEREHSAQ